MVDRRLFSRWMLLSLALTACGTTGRPVTQSSLTATITPLPASAAPELVLTLTANRLERPVMLDPPAQADTGAEVYWLVCLPCHGDRGQGLTDEWREVFGPEDMDCWQSKCHASNHPDPGFELPRTIPAVLGPGTLTRLANGLELYNLIAGSMPWWNPGSLSAQESWALTAYLLRERSALPERVTLNAGNAPIFSLHAPFAQSGDERPGIVLLIGLLVITAVAFAAQNARRR